MAASATHANVAMANTITAVIIRKPSDALGAKGHVLPHGTKQSLRRIFWESSVQLMSEDGLT